MKVMRTYMAGVVVLCLAAVAVAQDTKKETQTVVAKAESVQRAKFVDFGGELGLPLVSLETLGQRIDDARLAANPVELAAAAKLLEAAEGAAGKQASMTAKALLAESVELAKQRGDLAELTTIAKLVGGAAAEDLEAFAAALKDKQGDSGEVERALDGDLIVDNHSHSEVFVYVNGREVGHVPAHGQRSFCVHQADHAMARSRYGRRWTVHFEYGHYHRYRMLIPESHHDH